MHPVCGLWLGETSGYWYPPPSLTHCVPPPPEVDQRQPFNWFATPKIGDVTTPIDKLGHPCSLHWQATSPDSVWFSVELATTPQQQSDFWVKKQTGFVFEMGWNVAQEKHFGFSIRLCSILSFCSWLTWRLSWWGSSRSSAGREPRVERRAPYSRQNELHTRFVLPHSPLVSCCPSSVFVEWLVMFVRPIGHHPSPDSHTPSVGPHRHECFTRPAHTFMIQKYSSVFSAHFVFMCCLCTIYLAQRYQAFERVSRNSSPWLCTTKLQENTEMFSGSKQSF